MGVMVSEVYDAFVEAGTSKNTARRAAESIPVNDQLATKQDIGDLKNEIGEVRSDMAVIKADLKVSTATLEAKIAGSEAKMWRLAITVAGLAVLLNKFLDWVIPGK